MRAKGRLLNVDSVSFTSGGMGRREKRGVRCETLPRNVIRLYARPTDRPDLIHCIEPRCTVTKTYPLVRTVYVRLLFAQQS